jgi:hypothetical protein
MTSLRKLHQEAGLIVGHRKVFDRSLDSGRRVLRSAATLTSCFGRSVPRIRQLVFGLLFKRSARCVRAVGWVIDVLPEAEEKFAALREQVMWAQPVNCPMHIRAHAVDRMVEGEFWDERLRLSVSFVRNCRLRETEKAISAAIADGSMKQQVDGVNGLPACRGGSMSAFLRR